ncbi:GNAT family N-acetyltransferase [Actinoallomurus sp. NPDC052308]|uniref:bifunctional acetate--CoA ligase family protein/GNAT family N-acetyltransferase n=1 Tax=Actinoallomurus sp. NPDC052308 TaxID=3155530 RepID=UPI0034285406
MPYPDHWEADVVLADGGTAHLRPIRAGDAELLREFYARLSPESIYYRFFSPRPQLSDREIEHFTTVDYVDRVALIATIGDAMIAVVRYDRLGRRPGAPGGADSGSAGPGGDIWRAAVTGYTAATAESAGTAEVAFLVEDAQQGRGLGTVLLEHIAAAARERGIRRFIADVLPENRRMTTVFRAAGYEAQQRFEDGVIRLTLDLEPTETSREVMAAREHRAESRSIERLLSPRSVAVIGASREARSVGQTVLRNLLGGDFTGPVFPVNPTAPAVAGVRAHPTVAAIPDPVDLAVVAVPGEHVNEVVAQCAAKGVHGLVVVSSGFGEAGPEGRARQDDLVRLARANGMRVVGPNCLGIANSDPAVRLNATLAPTLPGRGPVGFFSQSGALGITILRWAAERGLGLSTFVSAGNRADVSGNDLMQYWEEDPATEVILLYLESIGNPRKFTRLARRISRAKPIVAVKSGRTTQGVPLGHAARALSLPDHAVSALFAQAGVVRVDTLGDLFDVAQILAYQPLPTGRRVAIVGNSNSIALLAQDAATAADLDPLPPVELGPAAGPAEFEAALAGILADEEADAVVTVFAPPVRGGLDPEVAAAIVRQAEGAAKPVIATYLGERGLLHGSVPSYPAPEDAVRALAYAVRYAERRRRPPGRVPALSGVDRDRARTLIEELLAAPVAVPADPPVRTADPAPVDRRELEPERTAELLACYGIEPADGAEADGAGIVTQIRTAEDPSFGAIVSFGLADPTAELLEDRAYRLAPLTDVEAAGLVRAIRAAPLLLGHRGAEPVDVAALEHLLLRASRLSDDLPEVARLELEVVARTSGAVVRSARLWLARPPGPRIDHVRRLRPS